MSDDFWNKVSECKHENLYPNYCVYISCLTPYCSSAEYHCKDCGVYIRKCGCGYNDGLSGWSWSRWYRSRKQVKIGVSSE